MDILKQIEPVFQVIVTDIPVGQTLESFVKLKKPEKKITVKERKMCKDITYSGEGYEKIYRKKKYFVPDGKGSSNLPNGDIYVGTWLNGILHGICLYKSMTFKFDYVGEFELGIMQGHGKLSFDKDQVVSIEGTWINNKANGNVVVEYQDKSKYVGTMRNFNKHGKGLFFGHDGVIINANWHNDLLNGKAEIHLPNCKIECKYFKGKLLSYCKIYFADKSFYKGHCGDTFLQHGTGVMKYSDGSIYKGSWINGQKSGHGFYYSSNGDYYNGSWINGKKHGIGCYYSKVGAQAVEFVWENDIRKNIIRLYQY